MPEPIISAGRIVRSFALSLLLLALSGCLEQTGSDRAAKLAVELDQARNEAAGLEAAIDSSQAALREMFRGASGDLSDPFSTYQASVTQLDKALRRFLTGQERVATAGSRYFSNWEQDTVEIAADDVRNLSEQRRGELQASHAEVVRQGQALRADLNVFLSDLRDVQRYLQTDLSATGVQTLIPVLQRIEQQALPLKDSLRELADQSHALARRIVPTTATGPAR